MSEKYILVALLVFNIVACIANLRLLQKSKTTLARAERLLEMIKAGEFEQ